MNIQDAILNKYQSLQSYNDTGTAVMQITTNAMVIESEFSFSTSYKKENHFKLEYKKRDTTSPKMIHSGLIQQDHPNENAKVFSTANGQELMSLDLPLPMALSALKGVSSRISFYVPKLLFGEEINGRQFCEGDQVEAFELNEGNQEYFVWKQIENLENKIPKKTANQLKKLSSMIPLKDKPQIDEAIDIQKEMEEESEILKHQVVTQYYFRKSDLLLVKVIQSNLSEHLNSEITIDLNPVAS